MASGSINEIEERANNIEDNSKLIEEIKWINGNITNCNAKLDLPYYPMLNKLNNESEIYRSVMKKLSDIISYFDDAISFMSKLDSSYAWKNQIFDYLKNKIFNRNGIRDVVLDDFSRYKREIENYMNHDRGHYYDKLEALLEQSCQAEKDIGTISTSDIKTIINRLDFEIKNISNQLSSHISKRKKEVDSLGYTAVKHIRGIVDYIVNFAKDESLTKIRLEYHKILRENNQSDITSLNIDFSKRDEKESQLATPPSEISSSLEKCTDQEIMINKFISLSLISLEACYSIDQIKQQFETVNMIL